MVLADDDGLAVAAVLVLSALVVVERRVAEPIVPIHLFHQATFNVASSVSSIIGGVMFGVGIGLTMQTLILSVQNVVPLTELGVATSAVSYFRSMGGAIGVDAIQALPDAERQPYVEGFADALTTVFLYATPLVVAAFGIICLLREVPLRSTNHTVERPRRQRDHRMIEPPSTGIVWPWMKSAWSLARKHTTRAMSIGRP